MSIAMTLRPCRRSAESVSSSFRSGSRIYAKTTGNFYLRGPACRQPNSLNTTRSISSSLALSKGRVSWIGTLSDYASNTNTSIKPALHHQSYFDGQLRFSSSSSSSNISVSKKQGENEDVVQETGRIQAAETLPCKDDNENNAHGTDKNGDKNKSSNSDMLKATTDEETPPKKTFRSMVQQYGKVFIATYMAVYVSTVLGLFVGVQSGQLDAMYIMSLLTGSSAPAEPGGVADPDTIQEAATAMKDMVEFLETYTLTRPFAPMVEQYPWTGNFAIAWIATKFTEPIRFGVTVMVTPSIAKFFGYRPIPTAVKNGPIDVVSEQKDLSSSSNTEKSSGSAPSSSSSSSS